LVVYQFAANRAEFQDWAVVPAEQWIRLRVDAPIEIRYAASDPSVNHPAQWEKETAIAGPALGTMVCALISAVCIWGLKTGAHILAKGLPAPGVITEVSRVKDSWSVKYQYATAAGTIRRGRDSCSQVLPLGGTVCILYDPQSTARSRIYPMRLYRLES
jgi:hypothetical protein